MTSDVDRIGAPTRMNDVAPTSFRLRMARAFFISSMNNPLLIQYFKIHGFAVSKPMFTVSNLPPNIYLHCEMNSGETVSARVSKLNFSCEVFVKSFKIPSRAAKGTSL